MQLRRIATHEIYALAVLAFLAAHYGSSFMPDDHILIQLRFCAIFWFFPCGYNSGWRPTNGLWLGLVLVTAANVFGGLGFWPLNVLATLIAIKYLLDPLMEFCTKNPLRFIAVQLALVALIPPSLAVMQFGTLGFIVAEAGWLVRHRDMLLHGRKVAGWFLAYTAALFTACLFLFYDKMLDYPLWIVASTACACWYMWDFKDSVLQAVRHPPQNAFSRTVAFIGHHSLEIFVIHLLVIRALSYYVLTYQP